MAIFTLQHWVKILVETKVTGWRGPDKQSFGIKMMALNLSCNKTLSGQNKKLY
jgi:hypothetical protein